MHFLGTFSWCKTEKRRGRKSKQHRGLHWWWSGLLVMVSVMDSDRTRVWWTGRWWPILPAGHRHQLGDMLQDIPVPCQPGKALHGTMNMVPYTDCFLSSIISHISLLLPSSLLSSLTLLEGVVIFLPLTQGTRAREVQRSHSGFLNSWMHAETPQLGGAFPARVTSVGLTLSSPWAHGNSCLPLARSILCHCSIRQNKVRPGERKVEPQSFGLLQPSKTPLTPVSPPPTF